MEQTGAKSAIWWNIKCHYYSICWRHGSVSSPRHSMSWHQLSGSLPPVTKSSVIITTFRHTWTVFAAYDTSNISSATGTYNSNSSTHSAAYKCFWHLTFAKGHDTPLFGGRVQVMNIVSGMWTEFTGLDCLLCRTSHLVTSWLMTITSTHTTCTHR